MAKRSKRYRDALDKIDAERLYEPKDAFELLKDLGTVKYDATVECAVRLGVDTRKADQMVRGSVSLPNGIGKDVHVAVVATGGKATEAREAGADHVGDDELVEQLGDASFLDQIDAVIATPDMMGKLGRLGKSLGPRGLMPNPKSGTVTMDVAKAVSEIKSGRVEYRADRNGNVHTVLGKLSFSAQQLTENYGALIDEIIRQRPASAKGRYVLTAAVSTSASPSIRLDPTRAKDLVGES
ncbi:MAG: 50S ribosomal protein L1 [Nitriliruptoraceae bacterium]